MSNILKNKSKVNKGYQRSSTQALENAKTRETQVAWKKDK